MRRLTVLFVAAIVASCSSAKKEETLASAEKRDVASDTYMGPAGNFDYEYKGRTLKDGPGVVGIISDPQQKEFMETLSVRRYDLLLNNLFDTGVDHDNSTDCARLMATPHRTADGKCYLWGMQDKLPATAKHLAYKPRVGDNNQRFGRNAPREIVNKERYALMDPNPREVSRELFTRINGQTREADIINVLAAAWLQAQNHDWFTHGKNPKNERPLKVPAVRDDPVYPNGLEVPPTKTDQSPLPTNHYNKVYRNYVTHWWDASEIYGSDQATIDRVRGKNPQTGKYLPGGMIKVCGKRLCYDENGLPITGFSDNWWIGLELIHSLFALEHNHIAKELAKVVDCSRKSADECGDEIFQKARLVNAALIAKIHTVEWTPALLDNKMLHIGMRANWYGLKELLPGNVDIPMIREYLHKTDPRRAHAVSGLVGPGTLSLYDVPFTLTEEFVAVYRMHPLVPEKIMAKDPNTGKTVVEPVDVEKTIFRNADAMFKKASPAQWLYGFGTNHPGGLLLHNHPQFFQNLHAERNKGDTNAQENTTHMDLAAMDVLRDRERGVPRYNDFRRALRLKPIESFEELLDSKDPYYQRDLETLKRLYKNDVEKLDLLVGTLAEKDRYAGFAFGNTPFYIFALMASRRLMADPFFSDYYTPEVYTQWGLDHIQKNMMTDVIVRHHPELKKHFKGVTNAFRPWQPRYNEVKKKYAAAAASN